MATKKKTPTADDLVRDLTVALFAENRALRAENRLLKAQSDYLLEANHRLSQERAS
jgi:hypothetical protein